MSTADHENSRRSATTGILGRRILGGTFELGDRIGAGAMGEVFEARHITSGTAVAIKMLQRHLLDNQDLIRRFRREASHAAVLRHPHCVLILDSGQAETDPDPYIVMELLRGRDLGQVIRREFPLSIPRVVRIMSQVLAAVAEAHAHQIVHRDLKPNNIMLVERDGDPDFVKVCDFGIAKVIDTAGVLRPADSSLLTAQGMLCGTPEYMSPEQARAEILDGRSDLYSAAAILYQMVTGDVPFRARSPMGVLSRQITEPPEPPSMRRPDLVMPRGLEELILRGLAKRREQRPQSADEFRAELERAGLDVADATERPLPEPAAIQLSRQPPRRDAEVTTVAHAAALNQQKEEGAGVSRRWRRWIPLFVGGIALLGLSARLAVRKPDMFPRQANELPAPSRAGLLAAHAAEKPRMAFVTNSPPASAERDHTDRAVGGVPDPHLSPRPGAPDPGVSLVPPPRVTRGAPWRRRVVNRAPSRLTEPAGHQPFEAVVAEGERLMIDGRVAEACLRFEEVKALYPAAPSVYKLLGQCYMRSGKTWQAKTNYRRYLDLAPDASDAAFIISMVK